MDYHDVFLLLAATQYDILLLAKTFPQLINSCKSQLTFLLHFAGLMEQMNLVYGVDFPPSQFWFGSIITTVQYMALVCSTLCILSMTFERFYSIIKPHKAASFNTVKRAKFITFGNVLFSIVFDIPHLFTTALEGRQSIPFGKAMDKEWGQIYYWLSVLLIFAIPFILLLLMNSFIIHTLSKRSKFVLKQGNQGEGHNEGPSSKMKTSDMQIFAILLLVAFSFFVLSMPAFVTIMYVSNVELGDNPELIAKFHLVYNIGHKTHFTNNGINFFLYVISGHKFRSDLVKLFKRKRDNISDSVTNTRISSIEASRKYTSLFLSLRC